MYWRPVLFNHSAFIKLSSEHRTASSLFSTIVLSIICSLDAASSLDYVKPVPLLLQQPAFSYFDLLTNAAQCHSIQSIITPTDCDYACTKPCWVTHRPHLAPVPDARRNSGQFLTSASFMQHIAVLVSWPRNSDVFMPPWELHMQLPLFLHPSDSHDDGDEDPLMRRRHDGVLAATWVSNCIASNNRTHLLRELMRSVPTHSFGQCLNNARMPPEMEWLGPFTSKERHVLRKDNWQVTAVHVQ